MSAFQICLSTHIYENYIVYIQTAYSIAGIQTESDSTVVEMPCSEMFSDMMASQSGHNMAKHVD